MRYLRWFLLAIVVLVVVVLVVGWSLPERHTVTRRAQVAAPPERVFALISGVQRFPAWRTGVTRVEVLPSAGGDSTSRYREHGSDGAILYERDLDSAAMMMVTAIADPSLPFGGRWTYRVSPSAGGSTLTIREDGEVRNPVFRFVSRFVLGHEASVERYLGDVVRELGGRVEE